MVWNAEGNKSRAPTETQRKGTIAKYDPKNITSDMVKVLDNYVTTIAENVGYGGDDLYRTHLALMSSR